MPFAVDLHDLRGTEPSGWEALRRATELRANWAWPLVHADLGETPGVIAVVSRDGTPAALFAAAAVGPRRFGYLDVQAPQSSAQPGWWFAPSTVDERAGLVRAFLRAVRRRRGLGLGAVLWRQLTGQDVDWLPRPRVRRETMPVAVLDAPPSTDAWLRGLSRSRRHDLRRIRRALDRDTDLDVRTGPVGVVVTPDELAYLARLNFDKYAGRAAERNRGPRSPAWQQPSCGRDDVTAVVYRDGAGRLLAAGIVLEDRRLPIWLTWGALPLTAGGRRHLYFDMFHRLVERTVERQAMGVILGKGMTALKVDLGAHLVRQHAALTPM